MTVTVDATYENGTLRLDHRLPLKESEKVRVTVETRLSLAETTAGMIGWKGDAAAFERLAREASETASNTDS